MVKQVSKIRHLKKSKARTAWRWLEGLSDDKPRPEKVEGADGKLYPARKKNDLGNEPDAQICAPEKVIKIYHL